jgi:DnaJ-class molecular chaperone
MPRIHTHYDNLKVTRNAPPEVIRAAYKTLCQKFHPDRNPGNQDAAQVFLIIRSAYETLSDPVKRKEHDEWIAAVESEYQARSAAVIRRRTVAHKSGIARLRKLRRKRLRWQYALWLLVVALIFFSFLFV